MRIRGLAAALAAAALVAALVTPAAGDDATGQTATNTAPTNAAGTTAPTNASGWFTASNIGTAQPAPSGDAGDAGDAPSESLLTVEGTVIRLADSPEAAAIIVTDDGQHVPVAGDESAELPAGAQVTVALEIPQDVADDLDLTEDLDASTTAGAQVLEAVDAPLELSAVTDLEPIATAQAGISNAKTRYVDIAVNTNSTTGATMPSDAQITAWIGQISTYWRANTYNEFGPLQIRGSITRYKSALPCENKASSQQWAAEAASKVAKGRTLGYYYKAAQNPSHLILFGECRDDKKAAVASVGDSIDWGGFTNVEASLFSTPANASHALSALTHELGHNISLDHAGAINPATCDFDAVPAFTELEWCLHDEYGDVATVMGYANPSSYSLGLLDAYRRQSLGVLPTGALATISGNTTQTYTLNTVGAASGVRGIRIQASGRTYYVEYRTDTEEPTSRAIMTGKKRAVRVMEVAGTATILKPARGNLIPDDHANLALGAGDRWLSHAGDVYVEVTAASGTSAQVTVSVGAKQRVTVPTPELPVQPAVGQPVTAQVGATGPAGATLTYQWFVGAAPQAGATAATFTPTATARGTSVRVLVTAQATGRAPAQVASGEVAGYVPTSSPVILGKAKAGNTLTAMPGAPVPQGATLKYEWFRGGTAISGATGKTYVVKGADVGAQLRVRVTTTVGGVATAALSPSTAKVPEWFFLANAAPKVTGTKKPGGTLTVVTGTFMPAPTELRYRWYRENKLIAGATGRTYKLGPRDHGSVISAEVQPVRAGYKNEWWWSGEWLRITGGKVTVKAPALTGKVKVGTKVTPAGNSWVYNTKLTYQWLRDGKAIKGATKSTYTPKAADRGKKLSVRVKGTHPRAGTATKTTKKLTVGYGTLKAPTPKVKGTLKAGRTLTATVGTWTSGTKLTYQWYANGKAIKGATKKKYKLKGAQVNKTIKVKVTGKKTAYKTASKKSAATAKIKR